MLLTSEKADIFNKQDEAFRLFFSIVHFFFLRLCFFLLARSKIDDVDSIGDSIGEVIQITGRLPPGYCLRRRHWSMEGRQKFKKKKDKKPKQNRRNQHAAAADPVAFSPSRWMWRYADRFDYSLIG